jgi:hypothetical protein
MGKDLEEEIFRGQRVNDEVSKRFLSMVLRLSKKLHHLDFEKTLLVLAKALKAQRPGF